MNVDYFISKNNENNVLKLNKLQNVHKIYPNSCSNRMIDKKLSQFQPFFFKSSYNEKQKYLIKRRKLKQKILDIEHIRSHSLDSQIKFKRIQRNQNKRSTEMVIQENEQQNNGNQNILSNFKLMNKQYKQAINRKLISSQNQTNSSRIVQNNSSIICIVPLQKQAKVQEDKQRKQDNFLKRLEKRLFTQKLNTQIKKEINIWDKFQEDCKGEENFIKEMQNLGIFLNLDLKESINSTFSQVKSNQKKFKFFYAIITELQLENGLVNEFIYTKGLVYNQKFKADCNKLIIACQNLSIVLDKFNFEVSLRNKCNQLGSELIEYSFKSNSRLLYIYTTIFQANLLYYSKYYIGCIRVLRKCICLCNNTKISSQFMGNQLFILKRKIYFIFGKSFSQLFHYESALKYFLKYLIFCWATNNKNQELKAYDYIGLQYYYLNNLNLAQFYHFKQVNGYYEPDDSAQKQIQIKKVHQRARQNQIRLKVIGEHLINQAINDSGLLKEPISDDQMEISELDNQQLIHSVFNIHQLEEINKESNSKFFGHHYSLNKSQQKKILAEIIEKRPKHLKDYEDIKQNKALEQIGNKKIVKNDDYYQSIIQDNQKKNFEQRKKAYFTLQSQINVHHLSPTNEISNYNCFIPKLKYYDKTELPSIMYDETDLLSIRQIQHNICKFNDKLKFIKFKVENILNKISEIQIQQPEENKKHKQVQFKQEKIKNTKFQLQILKKIQIK